MVYTELFWVGYLTLAITYTCIWFGVFVYLITTIFFPQVATCKQCLCCCRKVKEKLKKDSEPDEETMNLIGERFTSSTLSSQSTSSIINNVSRRGKQTRGFLRPNQ